jgi:putative ABC transport system permease protein
MASTQLRLAVRNATRRKRRTALTVGMVVVGVALLLLMLTWIQGAHATLLGSATASGGHLRIAQPAYIEREQLLPLEEHIPEVEALAETVRRQPGVVAVEPRIVTGVTVTVGEEIGDVFARAVGGEQSYFEQQLEGREQLVRGRWFGANNDDLVVGSAVAEDTGAELGDELLLLGVTQDGALSPSVGRLVGVVHGDSELNQTVLVPLEDMRWLADIGEGATELLVYADSYEDASGLAARLRALPELSAYAVEAWSEREPWRSLAATMSAMQSILILIMVFLVALGILNTMTMSVLERTHEVGVLRALGMSRLGAVGLFVGEALAIGVLGGALGVALGIGPSLLLARYGIHIGAGAAEGIELALSETIYGEVSLGSVLLSFFLGVLMAAVGSLLPALRAASIQPVTAMRSGR